MPSLYNYNPPEKTPPMGGLTPPPAPLPPGGPMAPSPIPNAMPAAGGAAVLPTYKNNPWGFNPEINIHQMTSYLMDRTRDVESKGNYKADRGAPFASGAYQYQDQTWGNYKGFKRAVDAPNHIQDERFGNDMFNRLKKYQGDPFKAVVEHYRPADVNHPQRWNVVFGKDKQGNAYPTTAEYLSRIFPAEQVKRYLARFNTAGAASGPAIQYTGTGRP